MPSGRPDIRYGPRAASFARATQRGQERLSATGVDVGLVGGGVEEAGGGVRIARGDLDHPGLAVAVFVDELGLVVEGAVDRHDLARDRRVEIAQRLDALDRAEALPASSVSPTFTSRLDERDVAELLDGERR
jgi:hypothetical protein